MFKPRLILGFGISIWISIFFLVSVFLDLYEHYDLMKYMILVITFAISIVLTKLTKTSNIRDALMIGLIWALINFLLDGLITARYDPMIFSNRFSWLGYGCIFIAPIIYCFLSKKRSHI